MSEAVKRRWFRFSVRGLLVVVTVFSCWLGYQVNWIRQRRAVVADLPKWQAYQGQATGPMAQPSAPGLLWLLGEQGYVAVSVIVVVDDINEAFADSWPPDDVKNEIQRVETLFPEAVVEAAPIIQSSRGSSRP